MKITDRKRLDWVMPIITAVNTPEINRRFIYFGLALNRGFKGRDAIDEGMRIEGEENARAPRRPD